MLRIIYFCFQNNYSTALGSRGEVVQHRIPENSNPNSTTSLGSRDVQQHRIQEQNSNSSMGSRDVQQQTHRIPEISNSRPSMTSREVVHRISEVPTSTSRNPLGGREVVPQHRMSDVPQQSNSRTIGGRDVQPHDMPEVSGSNTRPTESLVNYICVLFFYFHLWFVAVFFTSIFGVHGSTYKTWFIFCLACA